MRHSFPILEFGMGQGQFHEQYFEKMPFLKRQAFNSSGFGWQTIDTALAHQDLGLEMLKVIKNGRVERSEYVEEFVDIGVRRRRIIKERFYELIRSGATVVLNRMELSSEAIRDICMQVGRLVGSQTAANAYASIGGEAALHVHWDTHDVFAVQLAGKKRWQLYRPTFPLPISSQESNEHKRDVPETPYLETILEAGDVMYVPRGWWHRVEPIENTETIHLAVGVHTPLMLDYLIWACGNLLPKHLEMRHSLLGREKDSELVSDALSLMSQLLNNQESLSLFRNRSRMRERTVTPFQINKLIRNGDVSWSSEDIVRLNSRVLESECEAVYINGSKIIFNTKDNKTENEIIKAISSKIQITVRELKEIFSDASETESVLKRLALADIVQIVPSHSHD